MEIIGTIDVCDEPISYQVQRYTSDGTMAAVEDAVQEESLLRVYVNDVLTMQLGCSANHLVELVVGRLYTEGIITSPEEIDRISICEYSMRADVYLQNRTADLTQAAVDTVPTCCTNNKMLNNYYNKNLPLAPLQNAAWSCEWVFAVAREFAKDKTAHARTRGAHSAYLAAPEGVLCVREDIGRHNAFDKVVGWALINRINLEHCLLYTSGRVPTDMVSKAIRSRIPVLVSKSVATDKTVQLAREFNLTLICNASANALDVMNSPTLPTEKVLRMSA